MAIPISNVPRRVQYSPSGVGPYAFTFEILVDTDLAVYQGTDLLTLTADYTVTINPNGTGSVTLTSAATGTITIIGARAIQRTTDFVTGGDFRANTVNDEMDSQTIFSQQLAEELGRGIKIAPYSPTTVNTELPAPVANGIVAWNSTANAINYISPADIGTAVAYATAYADTFTGNGSQVNFTLTRNPAVLFNLDVSLNGVTQVPGVDYTLSGTTLTMTTPPPNTSVLLAKYKEGLPNYEGDSQDVRFVPAGVGAQTTTVQAKLRETVSVKDFGAVGDGVTDDTAAIQAAIDYVGSVGGGKIVFPFGVYIVGSIFPKSNIKLFLQGSTLKLKSSTNGLLIAGNGTPGENFVIENGVLDGNKTNNNGDINLSGGTAFTSWDNVTLKNLTIQNVYRACIILAGTSTNTLIENIIIKDCGENNAFGKYSYGIEIYTQCKNTTINNVHVTNMFGYGFHFYGCVDATANNLRMDNFTKTGTIGITFTEAVRVKVSNVYVEGVTSGDAIEINDSTDIILDNCTVSNAGNRALLIGQNTSPAVNKRIKITNFACAGTVGTFSAALSNFEDSIIENSYFDKVLTAANEPLSNNNVIRNVTVNTTLASSSGVFVYRNRFVLDNVVFTDYTVAYKNASVMQLTVPQTTLPNGSTYTFDVAALLGAKLSTTGSVGGTISTQTQSDVVVTQGAFQHYGFLINTSPFSTVSLIGEAVTSIARRLTYAGSGQTITLTNSTGVDVRFSAEINFNMLGTVQ